MSEPANLSAANQLQREPQLPEPEFAWFALCCHILGKSPLFMVLLIEHHQDAFCWRCALEKGATPKDAVSAYRHFTGRKVPVDTSRCHYQLQVQTEYGSA